MALRRCLKYKGEKERERERKKRDCVSVCVCRPTPKSRQGYIRGWHWRRLARRIHRRRHRVAAEGAKKKKKGEGTRDFLSYGEKTAPFFFTSHRLKKKE